MISAKEVLIKPNTENPTSPTITVRTLSSVKVLSNVADTAIQNENKAEIKTIVCCYCCCIL